MYALSLFVWLRSFVDLKQNVGETTGLKDGNLSSLYYACIVANVGENQLKFIIKDFFFMICLK
jgi:hypothetical protein